MINFYYGTLIPGTDAGEGVYFIKQNNINDYYYEEDLKSKGCKEYQETNYEEWQKKQILKRFANLANININWDNVK